MDVVICATWDGGKEAEGSRICKEYNMVEQHAPNGTPTGAPFLTPRIDEHSYRLITLDNGLRALVVSDPTADKAAACVDVRVCLAGLHVAVITCFELAGSPR